MSTIITTDANDEAYMLAVGRGDWVVANALVESRVLNGLALDSKRHHLRHLDGRFLARGTEVIIFNRIRGTRRLRR